MVLLCFSTNFLLLKATEIGAFYKKPWRDPSQKILINPENQSR